MSKKYYKVPEDAVDFPFSAAVEAGGFIHISGQPSMDMATGKYLDADFVTQFNNVFGNLRKVLEATNLTMDDVVKCTVFLVDMRDYPVMNEMYIKQFGEKLPARSCYAVAGLPLGTKIEVELIAYREEN